MKIFCPACEKTIAAENVDLKSGWGKCSACNDVFTLSGVLKGYVQPNESDFEGGPVERPFDAWARLESTDDYLAIFLPPHGMRFANWSLLGFATFWLCFIAFWTAGALGVLGNKGAQPKQENILFACFSIPFWIVGLGMLGGVLWQARGTRSVYIDANQLFVERSCSIWRRRRLFDRSSVQHARPANKTV